MHPFLPYASETNMNLEKELFSFPLCELQNESMYIFKYEYLNIAGIFLNIFKLYKSHIFKVFV